MVVGAVACNSGPASRVGAVAAAPFRSFLERWRSRPVPHFQPCKHEQTRLSLCQPIENGLAGFVKADVAKKPKQQSGSPIDNAA